MIKCEKKAELFDYLSQVLVGTGENILNTGELVKLYCGSSHMKYHLNEQDTLLELLALYNDLHALYLKKERELKNKKEKIFNSKDFTTW